MTPARAIEIAHARVSIVDNGPGQYVVHTWSPKHNATWLSHPTDRNGAQTMAWVNKVQCALELLGVEDAGQVAQMALERGDYINRPDWRTFVRAEARYKQRREALDTLKERPAPR